MDQVDAMNRYWEVHPPVHVLVAAFLNYEKKKPAQTKEEIEAVFARVGAQNGEL